MQRRLGEELGVTGVALSLLLPDYRYCFARNGVVENEFCPVAVGVIDAAPRPNPDEVQAVRWMPWPEFLAETRRPNAYSEWCVEEAALLDADPAFDRFLRSLGGSPD